MRITKLPKETAAKIWEAYKKEKDGKTKARYQAVMLLVQGFGRDEVAKIVGANKHRVRQWVTIYNKYGLAGLTTKPYPGNNYLLSKTQKQAICDVITKKSPQDVGFAGDFWTTSQLRDLVLQKFSVVYRDRDSYRRLLNWCGLRFRKR